MRQHPPSNSIFGRRLHALRLVAGVAQDRLGVMLGLDEGTASARISRYENGVHEPPRGFVAKLANHFGVPVAYFYCDDDELAEIVAGYSHLDRTRRAALLDLVRET
jgi:transcriptional regulator with XRE-family HTH domain